MRLLSLYLFAAAAFERTIDDVVRWVSIQDREEVEAILQGIGDPFALDAWTAVWTGRWQLRQDFFSTAVAALDAFSSPAVRETLRHSEIDFGKFLDGEPNTIYLSAPMTDQSRLRPLFSAFLAQAVETIYAVASAERLPKPVLVVIDEAANIAPLENLPSIAGRPVGLQRPDHAAVSLPAVGGQPGPGALHPSRRGGHHLIDRRTQASGPGPHRLDPPDAGLDAAC